jgi:hypothetical protein
MITKIVEKLKKKQINVSAEQTSPITLKLTISSNDGKNEMIIEAKEVTAEVSKTYMEFIFDEETFLLVLELLEYIAKEMYRPLCLQTTLLERYTSFSLNTFLRQKNYKVLEGERFEKLSNIEKRYIQMSFMIQDDDGKLDSFIEVEPEIQRYMEETMKKEPLFLFTKKSNLSYNYYHSGKNETLEISYAGNEGVYITVLDGKKKEIKKENVKSPEEAKKFLEQRFSAIKKAQRVKQLFQPSKYFFEKYLFKKALYGIGKDMQQLIYSELQKVYTPNEIEEVCALHYKNNTGHEQFLNSQQRIISFNEYVVYYDLEKGKVFLTKKDSQTKENIKKFILALVEKELEQQIKDIF